MNLVSKHLTFQLRLLSSLTLQPKEPKVRHREFSFFHDPLLALLGVDISLGALVFSRVWEAFSGRVVPQPRHD